MHYWHDWQDGGWLGGSLMLISMLLLLAGFVTVAVILLRRFGRTPEAPNEALRILDERFARGEIDREEYEQRRDAIQR